MHHIQDSTENYLEGIYVLRDQLGHVRSIDLANYLDISRASVSAAVKKMEGEGLVNMAEDGELKLTIQGARVGKEIYDRHLTLKKLLMMVGVEETLADHDACRMEHAISKETFHTLKKYLQDNLPDFQE